MVVLCLVGDDVDAAVLGVGGDSGLVSQGPQEVGGEFFELAVVDAFLKCFEDEVSGMAFDSGRTGLIGSVVIGGVAGRSLFDDCGDFFHVIGAGFEGGEEFVCVLADLEECQC
ncbi:hypothetical protein D3C74_232170 [compost metagenome]